MNTETRAYWLASQQDSLGYIEEERLHGANGRLLVRVLVPDVRRWADDAHAVRNGPENTGIRCINHPVLGEIYEDLYESVRRERWPEHFWGEAEYEADRLASQAITGLAGIPWATLQAVKDRAAIMFAAARGELPADERDRLLAESGLADANRAMLGMMGSLAKRMTVRYHATSEKRLTREQEEGLMAMVRPTTGEAA